MKGAVEILIEEHSGDIENLLDISIENARYFGVKEPIAYKVLRDALAHLYSPGTEGENVWE